MDTVYQILNQLNAKRTGLIFSLFILLAFFMGLKPILNSRTEHPPTLDFTEFPMQFGDWKGEDSIGLDIRSLDILKLTTYVRRRYTDSNGRSVFLYIGYWANQTGEYQAAKHSPALCLPSNGWQTLHLDDEKYEIKDEPINKSIQLRRLKGELRANKELFYYWFFAGNEYYSQEWYALIKLSIANLIYGRNDGGIIEVTAKIKNNADHEKSLAESDQTIKDFLNVLTPYLHKKINGNKEINNT